MIHFLKEQRSKFTAWSQWQFSGRKGSGGKAEGIALVGMNSQRISMILHFFQRRPNNKKCLIK